MTESKLGADWAVLKRCSDWSWFELDFLKVCTPVNQH